MMFRQSRAPEGLSSKVVRILWSTAGISLLRLLLLPCLKIVSVREAAQGTNLTLILTGEHLRKVLDFLSPLNFRSIQQEKLSKWASETLEWIRQDNMFQGWLGSDGDILWGTGMRKFFQLNSSPTH